MKKTETNQTFKIKLKDEVSCRYCNFDFPPSTLQIHELKCEKKKQNSTDQNEKNKLFECSECDLTTYRKSTIKRHVLLEHNKEYVDVYPCKETSFEASDHHALHLKTHNMSKLFECSECDFKTDRKSNIKRHVLRVHDKEYVDVYPCEECSFEASDHHALKTHLKAHLNLKCQICEKKFTQKYNLKAHLITHGAKGEELLGSLEILYCQICTYKTIKPSNFKRHGLTHEAENAYEAENAHEAENDYELSCDHCGYRTKVKSYLTKHSKRHMNSKFFCSSCKHEFNEKKQLDSHILTHHGENENLLKTITSKIHNCDQCAYRSVNVKNVRKHMRKHNKDHDDDTEYGEV